VNADGLPYLFWRDKMKKLIPIIFLLVITLTIGSTASYAWFSMNRTVQATGMKIQATTSSSLVISNALAVGTAVTHNFTTSAKTLSPATHDSTWATYTNGLKVIDTTTAGNIDAATGYTDTYSYTTTTLNTHYVDYVVYIAAAGGELQTQDIVATFDDATKALTFTDVVNDTISALSVDFYVDYVTDGGVAAMTPSATTYIGTIAFANRATASLTILDNNTIPANGDAANALRVTMRIYFDGALEKSAGQAWVYTNSVDTSEISVGISFTAANG
jgi:hypothetical protein